MLNMNYPTLISANHIWAFRKKNQFFFFTPSNQCHFLLLFFFLTSAGNFINDVQTMIDSCLFHKMNSPSVFHWHIYSTKQYLRPSTATTWCTKYYSLNSQVGSYSKPYCPGPKHCWVKFVTNKEFRRDSIQIFIK